MQPDAPQHWAGADALPAAAPPKPSDECPDCDFDDLALNIAEIAMCDDDAPDGARVTEAPMPPATRSSGAHNSEHNFPNTFPPLPTQPLPWAELLFSPISLPLRPLYTSDTCLYPRPSCP